MTQDTAAPAGQINTNEHQPSIDTSAKVIQLRPPSRWQDPLKLIETEAPSKIGRIVLWSVASLTLLMIVWACVGKLDIVAGAEGKLASQTLLKIVQPAESGVVKELLVKEGDSVKAGQILVRLDPTVARAETASVSNDLQAQRLQVRRLEAELSHTPLMPKAGEDSALFAQVHSQYLARQKAYRDNLAQEQSLLQKAEFERRSALEIQAKLEQTLPSYKKTAEAYSTLEKAGFFGNLASEEKRREALEKGKDLAAQTASVAALNATITAQQKRISQLQSNYQADLQKELAEVRQKIGQLEPSFDKSSYKSGLMELRSPQDGTVKDLATTTIGAVVQPGTVVLTIVPKNEPLFADVAVKNEDIGFVQVGQKVQVKFAAYPFQRFGMLSGTLTHLSVDASEPSNPPANNAATKSNTSSQASTTYKARVQLDSQVLQAPNGEKLALQPGMQVLAEIHQGKRTVMQYLLSPVRKALSEAGHER